ncbi:MAG: hypothetical protein GEU73_05700 [Chloroflexi bacterium]|nr:hypothetical protein [Chloroflexota bacterium]
MIAASFDSIVPFPSAQQCYKLGATLAELLRDDARSIGINGSGGLSHDPGRPRSGWIDRPLDEWFLGRLAEGDGRATKVMCRFDSMTMRGGTGEMRAWITVAGAMEAIGTRATIVDYVPSYHAATGLAFASWRV